MLSCGPDCVFGWAPQKQTLTRGFECKEFIWELVPRDTGQGKGSSVRDGEEGDQRHGHEQKAAVDNWSLLGPFGRQLIGYKPRNEDYVVCRYNPYFEILKSVILSIKRELV